MNLYSIAACHYDCLCGFAWFSAHGSFNFGGGRGTTPACNGRYRRPGNGYDAYSGSAAGYLFLPGEWIPGERKNKCSPYADRFYAARSEEHASELQSLMRISYDVFCLKKKNNQI